MENYKIRVANEVESKEAINLFTELGYSRPTWASAKYNTDFICTCDDGDILCSDIDDGEKEINFPQLRDLVVFKRNDVGDANAYCNDNSEHYYISSSGEYFFYFEGDSVKKWMHSSNHISYLKQYAKPIESIMKEYLRKDVDGNYVIEVAAAAESKEHHARDWIDVTGADWAYKNTRGKIIAVNGVIGESFIRDLIWTRHTQPEALPFLDDEPKSLNDQYAEIEQVRQAIKSDGGSTDYYKKEIPKWMLEQFNKTGVIEAKDVIRLFLGNDFNKGNIFKAQVRINSLESGAGKEGISGEYDHNKIVFFAEDDRKAYLARNKLIKD